MTSLPAASPRGRYAPSPTGAIHLGNASTALLAWLSVRARGGRFVLRVEDLDRARSRPELIRPILDDLEWLGLDWDEGPDRGGPHGPYVQSERTAFYAEAFARLRRAGRVYPCFCSRRDIAAAASAPQEPGEERRYPGTCRALDPHEADRRVTRGERHAWRLRVAADARPRFVDRVHGPWGMPRSEAPGDFVVHRSDGMFAYQLAVVVDDAAMDIGEVVRGDDLLESTLQQLLLYEELRLAAPAFGHVPLLFGTDGARLSKRQRGITLDELRGAGFAPAEIVGRLAHLLGLQPEPSRLTPRELVAGFTFERLRPRPGGLVADPTAWRQGA